jgi:hypothetical protein
LGFIQQQQNCFNETQPYDPAPLVAVAALFAVIAMPAVFWPARQASQLDPVVTLWHE